jgi:hypothetical protein
VSARAGEDQAETKRLREQLKRVESDSAIGEVETEIFEQLARIRAAVAGDITDATGAEAVRATLMRLFDHFTLHVELPERANVDLIDSRCWIEPTVSAHSLAGYDDQMRPVVTRQPLEQAADNYAEGFIRYSTKPSGASWTAEEIGTGAMKGASCLSSSFCAVVDDSGHVHIATTEEHIKEFGGVGWTVTDVDGTTPLRDIACSSTSACVAVNGSDELLSLAVGPSGEATASGKDLEGAGELIAVACTAQTCAAIDDNGAVFASTNGGVDWSMRYGGGSGLTSASCASASLCAAVTKTGDATTFNPANTSAPLTITNTSLPAGSAGAPYEAEVQASGGEGPYQWSATGLPPGLSIDEATGRITGSPSTATCVASPCPQPPATYTPTITVSDTGSAHSEASLELAIAGETHALKVAISGIGAGEVGSSPAGIEECGTARGTCEASFLDGTVVTLTAHPAPGSRFAGWSGGGCSGTGICQLTIGPDRSLTANFEKVKPIPANLRIGRARIMGSRCALRSHRPCAGLTIAVRGAIAKAARGIVIVKVGERHRGRRVTTTKRAPISHGHWHARLRLPPAGDIHTPIRIAARFAGSSGVLSGHAQRHLGKVLPLK